MRVLHLHPTFDGGGAPARAVRLINAFGPRLSHTVVSAVPHAVGAVEGVNRSIPVYYKANFPTLFGKPTPWRLLRLAQAMRAYDLVLTCGAGVLDAVLAHTLYARSLGLPALVHQEDAREAAEAAGRSPLRQLYRRLALHGAAALVVPSADMERCALETWQQPRDKVVRIASGLALSAYRKKAQADVLPGLIKRKGELWLGSFADMRDGRAAMALLGAFKGTQEQWQLVLAGEGPEQEAIRQAAVGMGLAHRVHLPGKVRDPAQVIALFDLYAVTSAEDAFPFEIVQAMAAGLAVLAPATQDARELLAEENRACLVPPGDDGGKALAELTGQTRLRSAIGAANARRAAERFDEQAMVAAYRSLFARVLGRASFP